MATYTRLGTASNLEFDGTYDILTFQFPNGYPNGVVNLAFGNSPRKVTGVQKVAQAFVQCLFTTKGSDPIRPNFGTEFVTTALTSNISRDPDLLTRDILEYIRDAEKQIKILLNSTSRDIASQLDSARLIIVDAQPDGVTVSIRITTRAGEAAAVAVPFPQTNLEFN